MKRCMVVLNPSSGKEKALQYEQLIIKQLHNYEVEVRHTEGEGDATRFAKEACDAQFDAIVLVGGDGTLNEGINGIAEQPHRPIVGIVPLGTVNDFARALGISLEPEEAIQLLGGASRKADIGKVNDHYFTNVVAIGSLADAVGDVSVEQKTALGPLAYLVEGVKAAVQNDSFQLDAELDGQRVQTEAMMFICVLTNTVGSFEQVTEDADVSDGLLHCFVIQSTNVMKVLGVAKNLLTGQYDDDENIERYDVKRAIVSADQPMELNVDGDLIGQVPANISILHNHIEFFAKN